MSRGSQPSEVTLTSRNKKSDNPVPMAGVPHHAARGYVQRLVESGRKVAICEQVEDPKIERSCEACGDPCSHSGSES